MGRLCRQSLSEGGFWTLSLSGHDSNCDRRPFPLPRYTPPVFTGARFPFLDFFDKLMFRKRAVNYFFFLINMGLRINLHLSPLIS